MNTKTNRIEQTFLIFIYVHLLFLSYDAWTRTYNLNMGFSLIFESILIYIIIFPLLGPLFIIGVEKSLQYIYNTWKNSVEILIQIPEDEIENGFSF